MNTAKNILVTGGAGFIGANLVHELIGNNEGSIHILAEKNTNPWRLQSVLSSVIIHEIDLADTENIRKLIHAIKPSTIYHLASFGGMPQQQDQKAIYDINFYGTINLLNACKEVGFECFINTGSSSEYGMKDAPMGEDIVLEPISDYGVAKAAATQFCLKEALFNKLPVYTIRPFSIYGDYEMPTRLIPTVLINAIQENTINLSSPHFVRDYMYINDMVSLFTTVAHRKPTGTYIFNGGTGIQSSISDVIATVQSLLPKQLNIQWNSSTPRPWEPKNWRANNHQSQTVLGWKPNYSLRDGLAASLTWFKQHINLYTQGVHHGRTQAHATTSQHIRNT